MENGRESTRVPRTRQEGPRRSPKPTITAPTDAIVKIAKTTICGTDLHILKGDVPTCVAGRILGTKASASSKRSERRSPGFKPGDRVLDLVHLARAENATIAGGGCTRTAPTAAGFSATSSTARRPSTSASRSPTRASITSRTGADEEALVMLSDILPTGFECGVLNGKVNPARPLPIVGAGPIGLAALLTAQFYSPAEIIMIDLDDNRLECRQRFGATATVNSSDGKAVEKVMALTGGRGVDTAIEAVGIPATFRYLPGHRGAGRPHREHRRARRKVDLHLEKLWIATSRSRRGSSTRSRTPMLLKTVHPQRSTRSG